LSDIVPYGEEPEEESTPLLETPTDLRPDLSALGLQEHERGWLRTLTKTVRFFVVPT